MSMGRANAIMSEVAPDTSRNGAGAGGTRVPTNPEAVERRFAQRLGWRAPIVRLGALFLAALSTLSIVAILWRVSVWHDSNAYEAGEAYVPAAILCAFLGAYAFFAAKAVTMSKRAVLGLRAAGWSFGPVFLLVAYFVEDSIARATLWSVGGAALAGSTSIALAIREPSTRFSTVELARVFGSDVDERRAADSDAPSTRDGAPPTHSAGARERPA